MSVTLEHANITVPDPRKTAAWMCEAFGWHIRWEGTLEAGGHAVHVGDDDRYLALFELQGDPAPQAQQYVTPGHINHLGFIVDDLAAAETAIRKAGFTPHHHADYDPGKRMYFFDDTGIEFELVEYAEAS